MTLTLNVKNRNKGEKTDGMMPAVMYGAHAVSTPIFINKIDFQKVRKAAGESSVIKLIGDSTENVLIQHVQMDPVLYLPIHADLYVVEKGQKVHVNVPINFVGESPAVKAGMNLIKVMHELSVNADPSKLPHEFEVSIENLVDSSSNITVADIKLPSGVELYHITENDVIMSVVAQSTEDLSEAVVAVDMDAIDVEKKGKKEEEGEEPAV